MAGAGDTDRMTDNRTIQSDDAECWKIFQERNQMEQAKWWAERTPKLKRDYRREHKGEYYLLLSIISILGGFVGVVYGLAGKGYIQKPYVIMGATMVLFGLSIVIGGFGKVKE